MWPLANAARVLCLDLENSLEPFISTAVSLMQQMTQRKWEAEEVEGENRLHSHRVSRHKDEHVPTAWGLA